MAIYNSAQFTAKSPMPVHGQALTTQWLYSTIAITAALTTADVLNFGYLPPNARIVAGILKGTDMDTGTPTLTFNVGDAADPDRYFTVSTVGQAGTVSTAMAATGYLYKTTAKTLVTGAVAANPATGVAGTLELALGYIVEDLPAS